MNLPSLTYDELAQVIILNLRKCPKLEIVIEKDPLLLEDFDLWINGVRHAGGQFRDILEAIAEYEYEPREAQT